MSSLLSTSRRRVGSRTVHCEGRRRRQIGVGDHHRLEQRPHRLRRARVHQPARACNRAAPELRLLATRRRHELRQPRLDPHPLWQHLPAERRNLRSQRALQCRRGLAWINRRRQRIGIGVGLYLLIWLVPLLFNQVLITSFALLTKPY